MAADMHRYTTKQDNDLTLGSAFQHPSDSSHDERPPREWLAVLNERLHHLSASVLELAGRLSVAKEDTADTRRRLAVIEERLSHTATKSWILGYGVAVLFTMLTGILGGVWWILQQAIGPLLRASAG